jgi:putative hydrolase of HD superfamily
MVSRYWISEETRWSAQGIAIYDPAMWRTGIGYEALGLWTDYLFQECPDWVRLDLRTWSGNPGMIGLARKLGYREEARFRRARIVDGAHYDGLGFGILRTEWAVRFPAGFAASLSARQSPPGENAGDAIRQGNIYWVAPSARHDVTLGNHPHPYVVVQEDHFNRSRVPTVIVCALTSNLHQVGEPGNLLLDPGEANLPQQSVVVVSKISTVDKAQIGAYIGSLNHERVAQILAGIRFQQSFYFQR